ncbi:MAG: sigma 54-interacting transcriptional regulator [Labilithrix sp.]|nr:sigma 54-interacting transcriptional regulator [Labilithrix sp.]
MDPVTTLGRIAEALADAHSLRRVRDAVLSALSREVSAVEIGDEAPGERPHGIVARFPDGRGYVALTPRGRQVMPPDFLAALGALVYAAVEHVEVVHRVAQVSRRAHVAERDLRDRLAASAHDDLVAASASMTTLVREVVPAVARHDTVVLLRGETGVGKEVVARRIHASSPRANRTFLQVNCGAIPEALVESALFGHERGAFTGAVGRHVGFFERAHLGTLFLDEIGDLPLASQVKLLRVLQTGEVERVGGERPVATRVRVIAATNRPLEEMVAAGRFREDLFYRVSVFPVVIPPLRQRPDDLDVLTTSIVARVATRMGRRPPHVPDVVRGKLRRHSWPGNVRELENVLERALVLSEGPELRVPFPLDPVNRIVAPEPGVVPLAEATRRAIARALEASRGRIYGPSGAAALLGLKPSTLQSKMAKLGLSRPR